MVKCNLCEYLDQEKEFDQLSPNEVYCELLGIVENVNCVCNFYEPTKEHTHVTLCIKES